MLRFQPNNESSVLCKCTLLDAYNPLGSLKLALTQDKEAAQTYERYLSGAYLVEKDEAEKRRGKNGC